MDAGKKKPVASAPQPGDIHLCISTLQNRPLLVHPVFIASAVWVGVIALYSLHLSKILVYSTEEVIAAALWIWAPIVIVAFIFNVLRKTLLFRSTKDSEKWQPDLDLIEQRLRLWFRIWLIAAIFETVVSGGVPLLWLFQSTTKNYDSYGVTSVHGIVKSLFISIALCRFSLWVITKNKHHLKIPIFALIWALILIDRSMFLVCMIEYIIVYLRFQSVRAVTILKIAIGGILFILGFGVVGDLRLQGSSEVFRALAQPADNYPLWLPSGILWAYIYITTPINNLVHTMRISLPVNNLLFPNTLALLFPTLIRQVLYGSAMGAALEGQLVNNTFNASTAYIGPYQDYGYLGIILFSVIIAFVCQRYWFSNDFKGNLKFSVVTQCLLLTLFYNHLFALPIIFQLVWLELFSMRRVRFGEKMGTNKNIGFKQPNSTELIDGKTS